MSTLLPLHRPRKLRKARKDSYDSDGYLSDGTKKKTDKKGQQKNVDSSQEREYQSEGGYLSDTTKRGKKKKQKDKKGDKVTDDRGSDSSIRTPHSSTKSRIPSDDVDLSESASLSEVSIKKKKTFFRFRSRSPSATRKSRAPGDTQPPPVPALPLVPLPSSESFARSPTPFDFPERNGGIPIQVMHSSVPPSVDESSISTPSLPRKVWPPMDNSRSSSRSLSVDESAENWTSSSSHEMGWHSPITPHMQTREGAPLNSQYLQSHEPESRAFNPRELMPVSAPAAPYQHSVRFAPSWRFPSSDPTLPIPPSPPIAIEKQPPRPKTSPQVSPRYKSSPVSVLPSSVPPSLHDHSPISALPEPLPFLSRTVRTTPSPLMFAPSTSPAIHRASPAISESSIVPSSDFIVPSPRPRFFEELPPPSPPPTCPLPDLPSHDLPSQKLPAVGRGRQLPFPTRGVLPVQEASRLIERTDRTRQDVLQKRLVTVQAEAQTKVPSGTVGNVVDDEDEDGGLPWLADRVPPMPPSSLERTHEDELDWPDDESVRPDVAQFYLYASPGHKGGEREATKHHSLDVPDDERSTYTYSFAASLQSADGRASGTIPSERSDVLSYYFDEPDRDNATEDKERFSRSSVADNERSREMRSRLIARIDTLYDADKIPPVPKLRQPF
jgi:hypothetical protein